ncbi:MAG: histidine kinase [Specibacter sp.]
MAADVPANHPSLAISLRVPIRIGEEAFGSLYLTEKAGGGDFTPEDEPLCTALAAASGVAIDKARHCETNAHRRAWLEAGVKANESILTAVNDSSAETLGVITTHALAASGSSLAVIAFPTADGLRLACLASTGAGALPSRQEFARLPVINRVMTSGVSATLRTAAEALGPWARGTLGPALVVALDHAGIGQGVMILARAATSFPYTPEDAETSILFSSRVALAVELLHERGTRESVLLSDDRDRIARDLHDRVIQRIFAAVLSLQSLRRVITDEPSLQLVLAITNELDISIRELRETIYSLNQQPDVREQLGHRLLRTITTLSADAGFEPRIDFAGPLDDGIPVAVSEHLVAVLTEGLSNTIRHSGASNVTITVDVGPLYLALVITDDGDGFDSPCHTSGLRTMNDRATLLGGTCAVESTPGKGTELTWRVPHNRPGAKAAQ